MGTPRNDEHGLVCAECGYALDGLDPDAACPECGGFERRERGWRLGRRARKTWMVLGFAMGPSVALVGLAAGLPGWMIARFFGWFDFSPVALLVLGPVAVLHGALVGAATINAERLGFGRRSRLAAWVILLAPVVVGVDMVVFLAIWFRVAIIPV